MTHHVPNLCLFAYSPSETYTREKSLDMTMGIQSCHGQQQPETYNTPKDLCHLAFKSFNMNAVDKTRANSCVTLESMVPIEGRLHLASLCLYTIGVLFIPNVSVELSNGGNEEVPIT